MRPLLKYGTLILILVGLCFVYFLSQQAPIKQITPEKITPIQSAKVRRQLKALYVSALGSSESQQFVNISPNIAGHIAKVHFTSGQKVKAGSPLIELDQRVMKNELNAILATYQLSKLNYQRAQQLSNKKIGSTLALDTARAEYKEKAAQLKIKQAQLAQMTLRAPFSGVLGKSHVNLGQYVSPGQPLVELSNTNKLHVSYALPERYLGRIQLGQQVKLSTEANTQRLYKGTVSFISPTVNKDSRTISVEATIDNPQHKLAAGMFLNVKHYLNIKKPVLLIPEQSLLPTIDGYNVFVVTNNKAFLRKVTIGRHHKNGVSIQQGLSTNERIVIAGQEKLSDATPVSEQRGS